MTPFAKAAMSMVVCVKGPQRRARRPPIVIGARRRAMRAGGARYAAIATPIEFDHTHLGSPNGCRRQILEAKSQGEINNAPFQGVDFGHAALPDEYDFA